MNRTCAIKSLPEQSRKVAILKSYFELMQKLNTAVLFARIYIYTPTNSHTLCVIFTDVTL